MAYALYRTTKLKTFGAILGSAAHNCRSRNTPNADAERTPENEQLLGGPGRIPTPDELLAEWQRRAGSARRKRDAVLLQEIFLGTSPEFYTTGETEAARLDLLRQWQARSLRWLEEQFGDLVLSATLHIDETTPHICAYVVPLQRAKNGDVWLSAKKLFNPVTLTQQQDTYAAGLAELGLSRGIAGSRAKHVSLKAFYSQVEHEPAAVRDLVASCESLELAIPEKDPFESAKTYAERVRQAVRAQTATIMGAARKVESIAKTAESDRRKAQMATSTNSALAVQNAGLRDLANQVRDIALPEVMLRLGFGEPVKEGGALVWRTGEHAVNINGSRWFDHKAGLGGGKAIDLVRHMMKCDFAGAVGWLSGQWTVAQAAGAVRAAAEQQVSEVPRKDFQELWRYYAERSEAATDAVRAYLTVSRGLDAATVSLAIRHGWLHGSIQRLRDGGERNWCVFPHQATDGRILGASLRAADEDEGGKRCIGDKKSSFFAIGPAIQTASELAITESPVDALSYYQRVPSARVLSVGGSSIPEAVVEFVASTRCTIPVVVALDNDVAGYNGWMAFVEQLRVFGAAVLRRVKRAIPALGDWPVKDWNDLIRAVSTERTAASPATDMPKLLEAKSGRRSRSRGKFLPPLTG